MEKAYRHGRLLDIDESADRMGVTPRMIRRLVTEQRIEVTRIGRHIRISETAIDAFIRAGTQRIAASG